MPRLRPIVAAHLKPRALLPQHILEAKKARDGARDVIWVKDLPKSSLPNLKDIPIPPVVEKWKTIVREVASKRLITVEKMVSTDRHRIYAEARQEAAYRMAVELKMSYPAIARRLGFTNHTSAIHAANVYAVRNGLKLNKDEETQRYIRARDAEIVRGLLLGETPEEMAARHDLTLVRIKDIVREKAKLLASKSVKSVLAKLENGQ